MLSEREFEVCGYEIVSDDCDVIAAALQRFCDESKADVIFTTGGTGLGPRDVTPEATMRVCERMVPGLAELMRAESMQKTPYASLSRAAAGIRDRSLIINLPGSPKAVRECLTMLVDLLAHAVKMLHGAGH